MRECGRVFDGLPGALGENGSIGWHASLSRVVVRCRTIAETATVAGFWLVLKCQDLLVLWRGGPY